MIRVPLVLALLAPAVLSASPPAIAITSSYLTGFTPFSTRVRISLTPDHRNRWVCLYVQQVDGEMVDRTSCWEVQAEQEARTTWKTLQLDAGEWDITAAVLRNDDQGVLSNRLTAHVFSPSR